MKTRIAASLIVIVICVSVPGQELFQLSAKANSKLKGSTFEIALFEDALVVNSSGTQVRKQSTGLTTAARRLHELLTTGEMRTVINFQRCGHALVIRVFVCSVAADSEVYSCDYTLLSARLKKGSGGCEL